jgi:hypothetical protein
VRLKLEIGEAQLCELVRTYLADKLGSVNLEARDVVIEVKSRQNYKAEWEPAAFRARVDKEVD